MSLWFSTTTHGKRCGSVHARSILGYTYTHAFHLKFMHLALVGMFEMHSFSISVVGCICFFTYSKVLCEGCQWLFSRVAFSFLENKTRISGLCSTSAVQYLISCIIIMKYQRTTYLITAGCNLAVSILAFITTTGCTLTVSILGRYAYRLWT